MPWSTWTTLNCRFQRGASSIKARSKKTESAPPETATPTRAPGGNMLWRAINAAIRSSIMHTVLIRGLPIFGQRLGHRDAGHHLFAHGGVINEGCHDGRALHHITRLHAIVYIHIGVMRSRVVLHWILHKTEAGESDIVERCMVGAAGPPGRKRCDARDRGRSQIVERLQPSLEDGLDLEVTLRADTSKFPGTCVVVIIRVQLVVLGFGLHGFAIGEVLLDVGL